MRRELTSAWVSVLLGCANAPEVVPTRVDTAPAEPARCTPDERGQALAAVLDFGYAAGLHHGLVRVAAPACVDTSGVHRDIELTTVPLDDVCALNEPGPLDPHAERLPGDRWGGWPGEVSGWDCPHIGGQTLVLRRVDGVWRVVGPLLEWRY